MTHKYTITAANYNETQVTPNPKIIFTGSVDGVSYVFNTSWNQVMYAQASGGTPAVQSVLAALMLNTVSIYRRIPTKWFYAQVEVPKYSTSASIPTPTFDRNGGRVTVPEVTDCGTWTQ